jgi:hypothetical protein
VNPSSPEDDFSLTYNCLQWADNNRTYNDGYHIQHHSNSRTHWSELPTVFMKQLALHDEKDGEWGLGLLVVGGGRGRGMDIQHHSNSRTHWSELPLCSSSSWP